VELAELIKARVPLAQVVGDVGRRTSFEVTVNGTLIHSKLKTMGFPNYDEVVKIVEDVAKGSDPTPVINVEKSGCVIL